MAKVNQSTQEAVLPGWDIKYGSEQVPNILVDFICETCAYATLLDNSPKSSPLGRFSLFLQAGSTNSLGQGNLVSTTVSQTGIVPLGSQTLQFYARLSPFASDLRVSLGGETLSLTPVSPAGGAYNVEAPIGVFAGKRETLAFTVDPGAQAPAGFFGYVTLDNISFSPVALFAPEPSTWSLAALGILGLVVIARRS